MNRSPPTADHITLADPNPPSSSQLEKSSLRTIEEIQTFGNNYLPAPYWIRVIRVVIPLSTRLDANQTLIATLGEDEINNVIGGRQWWQCTAHRENGIDGEWISMKRDWEGLGKDGRKGAGRKGGKSEEEVEREQVKELKRQAKEREEGRWRKGREDNDKRDRDDETLNGPWAEADGAKPQNADATEGAAGADTYSDDLDEMR